MSVICRITIALILREFSLTDAAGNNTRLESADLHQLGLPTQFAVGIAPTLKIARQADSLLISWPALASSFSLQSRDDFGQSIPWAPVGLSSVVFSEDAVVTVPASAGRKFYRLVEP